VEIITGEHAPEHFQGLDMVVLSPAVPRAAVEPLLPKTGAPEILAEMELAGRYAQGKILAVTGSNGKTTSTALAAHVLKAAGLNVFTGGNIGAPLADFVAQGGQADILVLEVSSFQAQCLSTFKPDVAILLNFSPNHLDWHADMEEYLQAKLNLFAHMDAGGLAILPEPMHGDLEGREFTAARRAYFKASDRFESDVLPGAHNQANMEAVFMAVSRFGVSGQTMREAIETFTPFPHRMEKVHEENGVVWINDSKSTTLESMRAALETVKAPVILLAGGKFKGGDPAGVLPAIRGKVREVWLYGASREVFEAAWSGEVPIHYRTTLAEAVAAFRPELQAGDTVLLSPATSSFDQYGNYRLRGDDFRAIAKGAA
jgi:UDP-N-acetylmuramoylalanine--D-glutamate ligase